jgi:hypothetical protein
VIRLVRLCSNIIRLGGDIIRLIRLSGNIIKLSAKYWKEVKASQSL